jgi:hypothetical protein
MSYFIFKFHLQFFETKLGREKKGMEQSKRKDQNVQERNRREGGEGGGTRGKDNTTHWIQKFTINFPEYYLSPQKIIVNLERQ